MDAGTGRGGAWAREGGVGEGRGGEGRGGEGREGEKGSMPPHFLTPSAAYGIGYKIATYFLTVLILICIEFPF